MSSVKKWNTKADWQSWVNESISGTINVIDDSLQLPVGISSASFLSTIVDTERTGSILLSIVSEFDVPGTSTVEFSFRASENLFLQNDTSIIWTGFTGPGQFNSLVETELEDFGLLVQGRYHQVRVRLSANVSTPTISPILKSVQINTSLSSEFLYTSRPLYIPGTMSSQIVNFSGKKTIHKVSINLSVNDSDKRSFVVGKSDTVSFQASNFQDSRHSWVFQPMIHWALINNWKTSGTTIKNTLQDEKYDSVQDAVANAPYLKYNLFFPSKGVYYLWGRGFINNDGIYWSFDNDTSDLRKFTLGINQSGSLDIPKWTKVGSVFLEEGGLHSFTVYLGNLNTVILDQWYFTTNNTFENNLTDLDSPLPLSRTPFNTAIRLRSLDNGVLDSLEFPVDNLAITSWKPSVLIPSSGVFNYEIRNSLDNSGVSFTDGLSIDTWQIGGSINDSIGWDYVFSD